MPICEWGMKKAGTIPGSGLLPLRRTAVCRGRGRTPLRSPPYQMITRSSTGRNISPSVMPKAS